MKRVFQVQEQIIVVSLYIIGSQPYRIKDNRSRALSILNEKSLCRE